MPEQVAGIDQSRLPIFCQDWWTTIARGSSEYRELKVLHGDVVVGRLPLILTKSRFGLVTGGDPHWSHLGGPIVDHRLSHKEQEEVIRSLIQQLPPRSSFCFVCNPDLSYADVVRSVFKESGFDHTSQTTYVRHPFASEGVDARKRNHRGHIKRAAKELDCVDVTAREFVQFFETNLKARGKRSYAPLDTMEILIEEAISRGQARAIAARPNARSRSVDDSRSPSYDAAIVYVWDSNRCYYWLSTYRLRSADNSDAKPHPDATKLLAVKAMEQAEAMNLIFDADGVMAPGAENLYRNMFGLRQKERRDVFQRATILERFRKRFRQPLRASIPSFGAPVVLAIGCFGQQLLLP
jgi:hypothetical protein